jgi:hypothetical protein
MTFPYCTGYQNYTSVHTNNVISRELPSVLTGLDHSKLITSILTAVKTSLQKYCYTSVNQMCLLKKPKDLLQTLGIFATALNH